jgi:hypothetical protein
LSARAGAELPVVDGPFECLTDRVATEVLNAPGRSCPAKAEAIGILVAAGYVPTGRDQAIAAELTASPDLVRLFKADTAVRVTIGRQTTCCNEVTGQAWN